PQRHRCRARDAQAGREATAPETTRQIAAQLGLERIETRGEPQAQIEGAAIDALDFPDPGNAAALAVGAGEPGHAGEPPANGAPLKRQSRPYSRPACRHQAWAAPPVKGRRFRAAAPYRGGRG